MHACRDLYLQLNFHKRCVHQKSWMPSLKYSKAALYKLHCDFNQRQMEAGREPESSFFPTGQLHCSPACRPERLSF